MLSYLLKRHLSIPLMGFMNTLYDLALELLKWLGVPEDWAKMAAEDLMAKIEEMYEAKAEEG